MSILDGVQQVEIINQGSIDWLNIGITFVSIFLAAGLAYLSSLHQSKKQIKKQRNYEYWMEVYKKIEKISDAELSYITLTLRRVTDIFNCSDDNIRMDDIIVDTTTDFTNFSVVHHELETLMRVISKKDGKIYKEFYTLYIIYKKVSLEYCAELKHMIENIAIAKYNNDVKELYQIKKQLDSNLYNEEQVNASINLQKKLGEILEETF